MRSDPSSELDSASDPRWAGQRLEAVRSIAALVGHSARNRLTVVRGALELLEAGCAADLSLEQRSAFRAELDRFLDDFNLGLDMMRCQLGDVRRVSARTVIADAVSRWQPAAARAVVRLESADADGEDEILADPVLLRQALLNLLRNATAALRGRPGAVIQIRSLPGDPWCIEVEDNGPGLPAPLPEGAGLTLCRDALTLMGGSLELGPVWSGTGAVATLRLGRP